MKKILAVSFLLLSIGVRAQESTDNSTKDEFAKFSIGLGSGYDFGGVLGTRLTLSPVEAVGLFVGLGITALGSTGVDGGVLFRFAQDKRVNLTLLTMYGYHGVITGEGIIAEPNKVYNGFTLGWGIQRNSKKNRNYWSFGLLIPLRSQQFHDARQAIKNDPNLHIDFISPPFMFSVGYHFALFH